MMKYPAQAGGAASSPMVYNQQQSPLPPPPPQQHQQQEAMVGEEGGVVIGMEVEEGGDPIEILSADFDQRQPPSDPDFFNSFCDDFDDSDIS